MNTTPTANQYKGMMKFHKRAMKAYKQVGKIEDAKSARKAMIISYLKYREVR